MSLWTYITKFFAVLKAIFGKETVTPTVQPAVTQPSTTTKPNRTYKTLTVTDEGTPTDGQRYYLDVQVINYLLVQETDLTVKSEIRTLIKEKEAAGINAYEFETKLGRYEIVNGTFKRYPKTN